MKNFLYLPGYGSSPTASSFHQKIKLIRSIISSKQNDDDDDIVLHVLDTHGSYSPDAYSNGLKEECRNSSESFFDAVIGSSLGGFWAIHYATEVFHENVPFVVFNPVLDPFNQLVSVDPMTAASYEEIERIDTEELPIVPGLVIVSSDDPVIPSGPTIDFFSTRARVVVIESEDHTLNSDEDKYKKILTNFLLTDINRLAHR